MLIEKFYDIIDDELNGTIERYKDDPILKKCKQIQQKKGYAFLIWFLEFYGQKPLYQKTRKRTRPLIGRFQLSARAFQTDCARC